ncbi:unnamed protein product [Blepharisma stoltei]|uniref:Right handed beta helix domain-containing protein n=1 Tax=Blepharisma stoltei TaxID=1481888 RepID=A0AAU9K3L8_9CILI|nr:unnamed protein product [Blepharisma stoltei]
MDPPDNALIVAPGYGHYMTIQEAINAASNGSKIIVSPGLYSKPIKITKPGLIIEAKETNGEVQISVSRGPLISIRLNEGETCTIKGFKLIHSGEKDENEEFDWLAKLKSKTDANCGVQIFGGNVIIEDCQVTLSSIKAPMPAFFLNECQVHMSNCDVKGSLDISSTGIYAKDSNLAMQACKIYKHKNSAVLLDCTPNNVVTISECAIVNNSRCGILCQNVEFAPTVQHNKIMQNEGAGVLIMNGNIAKIKENDIKFNEVGIEIMDSNPVITKNKIRCNFGSGIAIRSYMTGSSVKIFGNQLYENENSIWIQGESCRSLIEDNPIICNNRKAGIRIEDSANAEIRGNDIYENICQGILMTTGTSAIIDKNCVYGNLRANIACGSGKIIISENRIYRGRCEGIFVFEGNGCEINSNEIYENNDGILVIESNLDIVKNLVHDNKRTGITIAGNGMCKVSENKAYRNTAVGFNIRDNVEGEILRNKAFENQIQICLITRKKWDIKILRNENEWVGEVQLPLQYSCQIF